MSVILSSELHYLRGPDGYVYTDSLHPYPYWTRYLGVFRRVHVVARVIDGPLPPGALRADGPDVTFAALPEFVGPGGLARVAPATIARVIDATGPRASAILRVPGFIGSLVWAALVARRRRFAVQVVGDPAASLAGSAAVRRFRGLGVALTRRQVASAIALTYVTRRALQVAYPAPPDAPVVSVSDVDLPDALFAAPPLPIEARTSLRAAFVGSLEQPYKGLDVLLAALARARTAVELTVIGDGRLRGELESLATRLGIAARVRFVGRLPSSAAVQAALPGHDVMIVPSRTEGLPRAMLEAMALGLPCIASAVGGVPELLEPVDTVAPEDTAALAALIDRLDVGRRRHMASYQRAVAAEFRQSERDRRLDGFYRAVAARS